MLDYFLFHNTSQKYKTMEWVGLRCPMHWGSAPVKSALKVGTSSNSSLTDPQLGTQIAQTRIQGRLPRAEFQNPSRPWEIAFRNNNLQNLHFHLAPEKWVTVCQKVWIWMPVIPDKIWILLVQQHIGYGYATQTLCKAKD